jgi:hypothetical protein
MITRFAQWIFRLISRPSAYQTELSRLEADRDLRLAMARDEQLIHKQAMLDNERHLKQERNKWRGLAIELIGMVEPSAFELDGEPLTVGSYTFEMKWTGKPEVHEVSIAEAVNDALVEAFDVAPVDRDDLVDFGEVYDNGE